MASDNQQVTWDVYERNLSVHRLGTYLEETCGDREAALQLYLWNADVSASFWRIIGFTELALRNKIDAQLSKHKDALIDSWLKDPLIIRPGTTSAQKVSKAQDQLNRSAKEVTHQRIVAELNLGFWQTLVSKKNRNLWPNISRGFLSERRITPNQFASLIEEFHQFRNRIAHHYKIWHLDLFHEYFIILEIMELLDPSFSALVAKQVPLLALLNSQPKCRHYEPNLGVS